VTICCQQQHRCNCSSSQPLKGRHLTASFIKPCACTCSLRGSSVGCWSTHWSATSTDKLLLLLLLLLLCLQGARLHLCVTSHRRKATRPSAHRHWVPVWTTAAWCLCCLLLHPTRCNRWVSGWVVGGTKRGGGVSVAGQVLGRGESLCGLLQHGVCAVCCCTTQNATGGAVGGGGWMSWSAAGWVWWQQQQQQQPASMALQSQGWSAC
jgi:hypothetical protein